MIVNKVSLCNFRNYKLESVSFDNKINIIHGNNAQGKTNLLEALYVTATSKSQRTSRDRELILFGEEEAHIKTEIVKNNYNYVIEIHLKKNSSKGIAVNRVPIKRAVELFELMNVVFFSPDDLNIINDGPAARRKWLDFELSFINREYYNLLINYNKVLKSRNALLVSLFKNPSLESTLEVWNKQLIYYGCAIIQKREEFIKELNEIISKIHYNISGGNDILKLKYEKNTDYKNFENKLRDNADRDRRTGTTNTGPHRDDLAFIVNDSDLRYFGSQGQKKTAALSLKLSEIEFIKLYKNDTPILLLDDVLSELDSSRQKYLLENLNDMQTIITCTGLDEFVKYRYPYNKIIYVENGKVIEKN